MKRTTKSLNLEDLGLEEIKIGTERIGIKENEPLKLAVLVSRDNVVSELQREYDRIVNELKDQRYRIDYYDESNKTKSPPRRCYDVFQMFVTKPKLI